MCQAATPGSRQLKRERTLRDSPDDDTDTKETLRGFYAQPAEEAEAFLDGLTDDLVDDSMPPEVRALGRTMHRWRSQLLAWHAAKVSNGPTEAANNLIKRIKRIGFGFRRFAHYRLRVLLYAGRPNWDRLATIKPR